MKRMRWYDYITYNIYWLGLNMASGSLTPIILPVPGGAVCGGRGQEHVPGRPALSGLIVAILVQPVAGLLSDRSTLRWGRRRPFIFIGTILSICLSGTHRPVRHLLAALCSRAAVAGLLQRRARRPAGLDPRPGAGRPTRARLRGQGCDGVAAGRSWCCSHRPTGGLGQGLGGHRDSSWLRSWSPC